MNIHAPFTKNQMAFYNKCVDDAYWFNVAEGGKRAGKNVLSVDAFAKLLDEHEDRLFLAAGVSATTAKLNILDCDGMGLLNYFEGRCREGKYKDRDCIKIDSITGEKIVLVSGGGKDGMEKLIKGNTYGMAYITEANECHPNFIKEVFDRTITSSNRKVFHDLNPKAPKHWYYTDILKYHEDSQIKNPEYGYNYGHFTLVDNMSLSDKKIKQVLSTYDKDTIWYKRDMRGERQSAEGIIYQKFADKPSDYIVDDIPPIWYGIIGVDFGGNKSAHAFTFTGFTQGYKEVITIKEYYNPERINPDKLTTDFCRFVKEVQKDYKVYRAYCDSAEQTLIAGFEAAVMREHIPIEICNARKSEINDRIAFTVALMGVGRYKVHRSCEHLIDSFQNAVYDEKSVDDKRLDDGTSNIDSLDSFEYSIETIMKDALMRG